MKLLYLSCHAILEYDELKMFDELGIDFFSLGSYIKPKFPVDPIRPAIDKQVDEALLSAAPFRENMPKEFIDNFDVIVIMDGAPSLEWLEANWERMKHKTVILRTIGQSNGTRELRIKEFKDKGLKLVRYSPREERMPNYAGHDAIIRFGKDPNELTNWNGNKQEIINFTQHLQARGEFCHYSLIIEVLSKVRFAHIYGPKNSNLGQINGGFLSYEDMLKKYRDSRAYFYNGTQPACYTLTFMEAMMTGIPLICIGDKHQTITKERCGDVYEIPDLIEPNKNGFISDDVGQLTDWCNMLLDNHTLAKNISEEARKTGVRLFSKDIIKEQWRKFLQI